MTATTVLTPDTATTVISDEIPPPRFSWAAAFAGAVAAAATIFFLLSLGAGVGLSLTTAPELLHGTAPTFLTGGAIYFLAVQAFGFAVGGYIVGRLIGFVPEPEKEEQFRSAAHGLVVWGVGVVATATMIAFSVLPLAGATAGATTAVATSDQTRLTPITTGYWVDFLFRPPSASRQAQLGWIQYAQADTTATDATQPDDATPADDEAATQNAPQTSTSAVQPSGAAAPNATASDAPRHLSTTTTDTTMMSSGVPSTSSPSPEFHTGSIISDKAEAGRILNVGLANGGRLSTGDHDQLAYMVAQDTGVNANEANRRVNYVESRIRNDETNAAETARKLTRNASLWIAFSLLFGAVVSMFSAMAARHLDDRISAGG